jgi:hypothetical protein
LTAVNASGDGLRYPVLVLTGTHFREVDMRIAVLGLLSAFALAMLPLAANAVPTGPSVPTVDSAQAVELVAGGGGKATPHHPRASKGSKATSARASGTR